MVRHLLAAGLITCTMLAASLPADAADVSSFSIAGVRLQMSADQAYAALLPHSTAPDGNGARPPEVTHQFCLGETKPTTVDFHIEPSGSCVRRIEASVNRSRIIVDLLEDLPAHPHRMLVARVNFTGVVAEENREAVNGFRKSVFSRYGSPTESEHADEFSPMSALSSTAYVWCSGGTKAVCNGETVTKPDAEISTLAASSYPAQSLILMHSSQLVLTDHAYIASRTRALNRTRARATRSDF